MIIYFYLFIPLLCRLAESSSIKGRNYKNDLVPFLSSRLDTQKDNSLKIVSNEPFVIQFQMPPESKENVHDGVKAKSKKKKRVSKIKPLRKKLRTRRDVSEAESRKEKPDESMEPPTEARRNPSQTQNFISRQEMLKALNIYLKKKETKKVKPNEMKNIKDVEKADGTSSRNLHHNRSPSLSDSDPHVKMMYPNTPKSDSRNYSYKDLIADRERLEQKINYIRNMLHVNDSTAEDPVRIRRKSDSDSTANKIAKMFLTLSAVNGLHDKKSKCRDDDDDHDIWEKERKKSPSSSNEERYKIKKWIEYMKSKRSSGKTCPCMNEYNEENDIFPLEQKLRKDYPLIETGVSSEEYSDRYRDPLGHSRGRLKSRPIRNGCKEEARSKLRALRNGGRKKYDLPTDDLEVYRSRAKQILQNAEDILDKIKEEEEKRLAAPHAIMSQLRELTSRIQGDPRNSENDLISIIQKNLGWSPQSKSQPDNNSFVENMKSFILDPYEKAKALTDESTRKLSSYLLRNLGKIDSEQEEAEGKSDERPQVFHGQVPQTEEMFSANLAKENPESDLLDKEREEHQNWSDTLSAILGGNDEDVGKENAGGGELKQIKGQDDSIKRRMEEMIKEQEKKIRENTEKPDRKKMEETTIIDLMTEEPNETPKGSKQSEGTERVEAVPESDKRDENVEESEIGGVSQNNAPQNESGMVRSAAEETESDVIALEHQLPAEDRTVNVETVGKRNDTEGEDSKIRDDFPLELQDVKAAISNDSTKEGETIAKNSGDDKELESATADENQEDVKDVIMETGSSFEKGTRGEEALKSSQEQQEQDDNAQSKQDREENDVLNSKHLVQESKERSEGEKLEAFTQDIRKLLDDTGERPEETAGKSAEYEGTIVKKKHDSSETKDPEENVAEINSSPDSEKMQTATTSEEGQKEFGSQSKALSNDGVVQASQDAKESLQYDHPEKDKTSTEKENSAEGLVETIIPESSEKSFVKSEKTEDSTEGIVKNAENSVEIEKERMNVDGVDKTKSIEEESDTEEDSLKSELGQTKKKDDKIRKELDDEKAKEQLDNEKIKEELDDEKVRVELDNEKVKELDDEKVREELEDEKANEELDDEKVKEFDDEKVKEFDDEKVKEFDDEKVREELEDEKANEELDDEKVREELDDEKVREELDDEKVREELDDEKVREELDDEKVREELDDEKVREELGSEEKEILRENLDDAEEDETNQEEPSLKASLDESDDEQKPIETSQSKSQEEGNENADESVDEISVQSENQENENLENGSGETSLKAVEQSQENEGVEGMENYEASLKASKPHNNEEIQDTIGKGNLRAVEQGNQEKDEPQVRAEVKEVEKIDMDNEESPLRSEKPEKDTEISNESLMNTSGSQEEVEAIHEETVNEENRETENKESIDETLKAIAVETDKGTEEIASAEIEKVEQPKETENVEEYSREANSNEDEPLEINKPPKLLMSIKENPVDEEPAKASREEENEESRAPIEDNLSVSEADDPEVESKYMSEEVPVRAANSEADQEQPVVQGTQEMDVEDDVNVRAENTKDLVNQIEDEGLKDGELRSAKAESEELNEDGSLDKDDVVEEVKKVEPETEQTVGKNALVSEAQGQSKSTLKVPKSIGKIMRDLDGKEKDDYVSLTNLNPEKIDHIIDKIDEAEHRSKVESDDVDCRKECACADEMNIRSRNIGRYEIAKDFLRWVKDLQLSRVLTDE